MPDGPVSVNDLAYGPISANATDGKVLGVRYMVCQDGAELASAVINDMELIEQLGVRMLLVATAMREGWPILKLQAWTKDVVAGASPSASSE